MERTHCMADAKHIRRFLNCCEGNWHRCVYVRCTACNTPAFCGCPDYLYHPDENGQPCVLSMRDAKLLFARIPEPTECTAAITLEQFSSLYQPYLSALGLSQSHCLIDALLKRAEGQNYDW